MPLFLPITKSDLWLFPAVSWVDLQCAIIILPGHTRLLFLKRPICDRSIFRQNHFFLFFSELFQDLSQMQETWLAEGKPLTGMLGKGRKKIY